MNCYLIQYKMLICNMKDADKSIYYSFSIEENFPIYDVGILLRKYLNKVTSFLSRILDTIYNRYQHS